ncbi:MAG TPA: hypothetical protein DCK93_04185 [Blastocatellia bacterium]|nr:hypothetical protein [Blastocatellia bacterium]HAF22103.1 hypothetical protein [Blastocatellia bacterium]
MKICLILTCGLLLFFSTTTQQRQATAGGLPLVISNSGKQAPDHGGQIDSKYDGFAHETVATLRKMRVTCASTKGNFKDTCVSMSASLHCPGIQLDYVRYATLQLVFETKDWDQRHPLDQRNLSVVADGQTLRLGRMELVSQSVDTLMTETLQVTIPYETFKKVALAQVVEMQVGKSKFELRDKNLAALRDLNNRVKL